MRNSFYNHIFPYDQVEGTIGHMIGDVFEAGGSITDKYSRIMSIPPVSNEPINPDITTHVCLSSRDKIIDNDRVLKDLGLIAGDVLRQHAVLPTGINYHDFKPQEWKDIARELFLPLINSEFHSAP